MNFDQAMKRALKLAIKGNGYVSPNPRVGAVIIKNGEAIAEGWHKEFGGLHAEIEAINNAGLDSFEDCTLVVNLEPCSHTGKTPPCADTIISKKFSRVVVGMTDPNPLVAGAGITKLLEAGIEVVSGIKEEECKWINRFFTKNITTGLPYVILKAAQSVDGCIATIRGDSKWITCEESRKRVHSLRAEVDGVAIGKRTAEKDNPMLTVRDVKGRDPKRIIFDTDLSLPLSIATYITGERNRTYVCCNKKALKTRKSETLRLAGINLIPVDLNEEGKMNIVSALYALAENDITSIMVEGGSLLLSSFLKAQMVDEFHFFIAPKLLGNGLNTFEKFNVNYLTEAYNFEFKAVSKSGSDLHLIGVR